MWNVVSQLTETNKQLVVTNQSRIEQLQQVLATNAKLIKLVGTTLTPKAPYVKKLFDRAAWLAKMNPNGYCWTHGYHVVKSHTSLSCTTKAPGHKDDATRTNTKGGSARGKDE